VLPATYSNYQINDRLYLGLSGAAAWPISPDSPSPMSGGKVPVVGVIRAEGATRVASPFGLITKPNQVWAGQTYSRSSKIFTLNFNPVIGSGSSSTSPAAPPPGRYRPTRRAR
jgi:long-chain fatty acid transport protein